MAVELETRMEELEALKSRMQAVTKSINVAVSELGS